MNVTVFGGAQPKEGSAAYEEARELGRLLAGRGHVVADLAKTAKNAGADIVIVHGETPVEPVAAGTNHAACVCKYVNVLAHPGLITLEDALHAAKNGIALEITSRGGHNRTNGHVAQIAREAACQIVVDSDAHAPHDLLDERAKFVVAKGAGLSDAECKQVIS